MADVKVSSKLKNRKKSALKAGRAAERRQVFNMRTKRAMKDIVKDVSQLIAAKKGSEAAALLSKAYQALDKAAKRNVIAKNTAARIKSRIAKQLRAIA